MTPARESNSATDTRTHLLSLKGVSKAFGANQALSGVDFEVDAGEVVALVGDNGAGKSTLVKAIAGVQLADEGTFYFDGKPVKISSPQDATDLGIATVYQDLALCDNLDVVANLYLGRELFAKGAARAAYFIDETAMEQSSLKLLDSLAVTTITDVRDHVASLSGGQRQAVAIARSLLGEPRVVLLDEPTAALGVSQTEQVLSLIGTLRNRGLGVVVISHNLENVFAVADRIIVLRLGRRAATFDVRGVSREDVVAAITGAEFGKVGAGVREEIGMSEQHQAPPSVRGVGDLVRGLGRKLAAGEAGALLVLLMVGAIWTFFQLQNDRFLSPGNLTNLMLQQSAVATISIGVVLILLLGEIDLSVGAASGFCASVMAVLMVNRGVSPFLSVMAALGLGAAIGLFNGFMVTRFRIPSFVVTLAGSLTLVGLQLYVLGETGTINLGDNFVTQLTGTFFPPLIGWIVAGVGIALMLAFALTGRARRQAAGLRVGSLQGLLFRTALISAAVVSLVFIVNQDRGLPLVVCIVFALALGFAYLTERTRFGRHMFAVGGYAEAARRAGIKIDHVRLIVFVLGSTLAAMGGVLAASRLMAVNQSSGGSDLLLMAIAGPVIAGTSLFGGRGSVWSALLGAVVIGSIANGMNLLALSSSVKYIVTGAVLIAAVTIESVTRMRRREGTTE